MHSLPLFSNASTMIINNTWFASFLLFLFLFFYNLGSL